MVKRVFERHGLGRLAFFLRSIRLRRLRVFEERRGFLVHHPSSIDLLRSKIANKNAQIERHWSTDLKMQGIPGELRQVFSTLLTNSLDAVDVGGRISIRASRRISNRVPMVRVIIADSGCGIHRDKRSEIFDPFFTTKHHVGNGLGLWVTNQLVEKHRGSIRMRSRTEQPVRGTTFSVSFPI